MVCTALIEGILSRFCRFIKGKGYSAKQQNTQIPKSVLAKLKCNHQQLEAKAEVKTDLFS
jgi:hypothetical protein